MSRNIFMTAVSNLNVKSFKKLTYEYKDEKGSLVEGKTYTGYFSGEPGIKCAIDDLLEQGLLFDKFVLFCSPKTMSKVDISDLIYDEDGSKAIDTNASLTNVSAYDYVEMIIREKIYEAILGKKSESVTEWFREKGYVSSEGIPTEETIERYIRTACRIDDGQPIIMDDNPDIETIKRNIESQQSGYEEKMNIYIDITGGTRITSIVAMLMSRWYEQNKEAYVSKVIYSSIMNDSRALILDWTKNYELFKIADSKSDLFSMILFSDENDRITKMLEKEELSLQDIHRYYKDSNKKIGDERIVSQRQYLERAKDVLEMDEEISTSIQGVYLIKLINSAINRYSRNSLSNAVGEYKEQKKNNKRESKPDEFIKKFHEGIIGSICEKNILTAENEDVADLIKYMNWYYKKDDNKYKRGVVYFVINMCKYLNNHLDISPHIHWSNMKKLDNRFYMDRYSSEREPNFVLNGANIKNNELFIERIKAHKINMFKGKIDINSFDDIKRYEVLRNIYFNQGFPFEFVNRRGKSYEDVKVFYLKKVNEMFNNLEKMYKEDKEAYKKELTQCMHVEYIQSIVPEYALPECIKINRQIFGGDDQKSEKFIKELKELREKARLFRNAEAHSDNAMFDEYRDDEKLERFADEILDWLESCKNDMGIDLM